jgi:hypothetical protein
MAFMRLTLSPSHAGLKQWLKKKADLRRHCSLLRVKKVHYFFAGSGEAAGAGVAGAADLGASVFFMDSPFSSFFIEDFMADFLALDFLVFGLASIA